MEPGTSPRVEPAPSPPSSAPAWGRSLLAATAIAAMGIPQGVAYAMIAGLPPVLGLYAGMLPAVIASLTRSSNYVVTGPTNAISLLFATSVAAQMPDPVAAAATLALLTGMMQVGGGLFRMKALVEYVSASVVLGYITGAAALIAVGQLPALTGTAGTGGDILARLLAWGSQLDALDPATLGVGLCSVAGIVAARAWLPRGSAELTVMVLASAGVAGLGLDVRTVVDLGGVPSGLPPLSLPSLEGASLLLPVAGAAAVLSMVESSSVARAIAARTGERLDMQREFVGQGLANLVAAACGTYPVSGSLSRSALNERLGGGRAAGTLSGVVAMVAVLLVAPLLELLPLSALAGLLLVVAVDLVEPARIRRVLSAPLADRLAYLATVLGTWFLPLDQAIYLGVGISVFQFLRQSRHLVVHELRFAADERVQEVDLDESDAEVLPCCSVRILNLEGPLFFASATELEHVLAESGADSAVRTLILRMRRTRDLDYTAAAVLVAAQERLAAQGRQLVLVGVREDMLARMREMGFVELFGEGLVFPGRAGWFESLNDALEHLPGPSCVRDAASCPLRPHLHPVPAQASTPSPEAP